MFHDEDERWDDQCWALYRRWVAVCSATMLALVLAGSASSVLGLPTIHIADEPTDVTADGLGGLGLLTVAQWAVVRRYVRRAKWWIPASVGGVALGMMLATAWLLLLDLLLRREVLQTTSQVLLSTLASATTMAGLFAGLGISQIWFFSGRSRQAAWWALDNGIGGAMAGGIMGLALAGSYDDRASLASQLGIVALTYLSVLVFVLYTGYTLVALLQEDLQRDGLQVEAAAIERPG